MPTPLRLGRITSLTLLTLGAFGASAGSAFAAPPIYLPWECNTQERVSQGRHNPDPDETHATGKSDQWAWDFVLELGEPIHAPADGVVRRADGSHERGGDWKQTNHVVLLFDDGTEAQMMHMDPGGVTVKPGQLVRRGEVVGYVGLSGRTSGAHLHFHIQSECLTGSTGWYCASIESEFIDVGVPTYGTTNPTSGNCALQPECMVGVDGPVEIDDGSSCFFQAHGTETWSSYEDPSDSYSVAIVPNAADGPTATGLWRFRVAETGYYQVEVLMPSSDPEAMTAGAVSYEVGSGAQTTTTETVSQRDNSASWVTLGDAFLLRHEAESYVKLTNFTGEPAGSTVVGFDQVRITWTGGYDPPACAVSGGTEIEQSSECFTTEGDNWFDDAGGRDGFSYSNSNANEVTSPLETGTWSFEPDSTELHQLWVYIPDDTDHRRTANATYFLYDGYATLQLDPVDQEGSSGWVQLRLEDGTEDQAAGNFWLYATRPARLWLGDATGEPFTGQDSPDNVWVVFDAIAVAPTADGFDPEVALGKGDDLGQATFGDERGAGEDGCACRADASGSGRGLTALGLLGLLGLLRRPRRRRR